MSTEQPCLYVGHTEHQRLRPQVHRLRYNLFQIACPVDRLHEMARDLKLLSIDRFNLFSVTRADHGPPGDEPLEQRLRALIVRQGAPSPARIVMVTMPRLLGYAFNPLTLFYAYDENDRLETLIYEVNNTFGERHHYVLPAKADARGAIRQDCPKDFYVSPFLAMNLHYRFRLKAPGERLFLVVQDHDAEGLLLTATLSAERTALTDSALLKLFIALPLMTLKVIAAIHWEALRLWLKRVPIHRHTPQVAPLSLSAQGTKHP